MAFPDYSGPHNQNARSSRLTFRRLSVELKEGKQGRLFVCPSSEAPSRWRQEMMVQVWSMMRSFAQIWLMRQGAKLSPLQAQQQRELQSQQEADRRRVEPQNSRCGDVLDTRALRWGDSGGTG
eukprot:768245-Hanusia_phi.AAC.7